MWRHVLSESNWFLLLLLYYLYCHTTCSHFIGQLTGPVPKQLTSSARSLWEDFRRRDRQKFEHRFDLTEGGCGFRRPSRGWSSASQGGGGCREMVELRGNFWNTVCVAPIKGCDSWTRDGIFSNPLAKQRERTSRTSDNVCRSRQQMRREDGRNCWLVVVSSNVPWSKVGWSFLYEILWIGVDVLIHDGRTIPCT